MTDLDLPLLPSAEQIRRREFATVRRGYDPDQVRDYLHQVATQVETLEQEARRLKLGGAATAASANEAIGAHRESEAPPDVDAYEVLGKRFSGLIEAADREATRTIDDARAEAARALTEARMEADRIRVDAQARAEEARHQGSDALVRAREEADRLLSSLSERRESLVEQMHEMRSRLLNVAHELATEMDEADEGAPDAGDATARTERSAERSAEKSAEKSGGAMTPATRGSSIPSSASLGTAPSRGGDDDPVDPRYEDLWSDPGAKGGDPTVDIPDLAAIDLDLDDDTRRD